MNSEQIHNLLERYWSCETSVEEEEDLQAFFSDGNVPEELRQFIPLFSYIRDERQVTLSDDFNGRLQHALEEEGRGRYITIRIFAPLLRVAVSVLLVIGLGISFYFISKKDNRPQFVETYKDPNAAMQQAVFALEKLSHALKKSETVSVKTLQIIDDLDINWAVIDSLNRISPLQTDSLQKER